MGCASSSFGKVKVNAAPMEGESSLSVNWRLHISPEQARINYIADGTLAPGSDDDELAFRALLDDSIALHYMQDFLVKCELGDVLKCWVDVLDFKKTPHGNLLVVKAIALYENFVKSGKATNSSLLTPAEVEEMESLILPLIATASSRGTVSEQANNNINNINNNNNNQGSVPTTSENVSSVESEGKAVAIGVGSTSSFRSDGSNAAPVSNRSLLSHPIKRSFKEQHASATLDGMYDCLLQKSFDLLFCEGYAKFVDSEKCFEMYDMIRKKYNHAKPSDFEYLKILGQGGYGMVAHVRKKSTGKHYAMKIQEKEGMYRSTVDSPWRVDFEKQAFASCHHPFIVELSYAFQTKTLVMLVMSLGTAGDLSGQLRSAPDQKFSLERTKFYVSEIVCVLVYLHSKGLIYRDLKPGNILLNDDGHIQLTDFGAVTDVNGQTLGIMSMLDLVPVFASKYEKTQNEGAGSPMRLSGPQDSESRKASYLSGSHSGEHSSISISHSHSYSNKEIMPSAQQPVRRAVSVVGTFGYMAPEMVVLLSQKGYEQVGYTKAVDWWSLGVCMYRMLVGHSPFPAVQLSQMVANLPDHAQELAEKVQMIGGRKAAQSGLEAHLHEFGAPGMCLQPEPSSSVSGDEFFLPDPDDWSETLERTEEEQKFVGKYLQLLQEIDYSDIVEMEGGPKRDNFPNGRGIAEVEQVEQVCSPQQVGEDRGSGSASATAYEDGGDRRRAHTKATECTATTLEVSALERSGSRSNSMLKESTSAVPFIRALLEVREERRLGGGPAGSFAVLQHPFFADTDWDVVNSKGMPPPCLPCASLKDGASNLDTAGVTPEGGGVADCERSDPMGAALLTTKKSAEFDNAGRRSAASSTTSVVYPNLEAIVRASGNDRWLKRSKYTQKIQRYFELWSYSSAAVIVMEHKAARCMRKEQLQRGRQESNQHLHVGAGGGSPLPGLLKGSDSQMGAFFTDSSDQPGGSDVDSRAGGFVQSPLGMDSLFSTGDRVCIPEGSPTAGSEKKDRYAVALPM